MADREKERKKGESMEDEYHDSSATKNIKGLNEPSAAKEAERRKKR